MNQDNNFSPIERLMEFGMSMAVANQMIQTMNDVLSKSKNPVMPGVQLPTPSTKMYFVVINDITQGPFTENEILKYIVSEQRTESTFVWHEGMSHWELSKDIPDVAKLFLLKPPKF